jgi:hypothetical protein
LFSPFKDLTPKIAFTTKYVQLGIWICRKHAEIMVKAGQMEEMTRKDAPAQMAEISHRGSGKEQFPAGRNGPVWRGNEAFRYLYSQR